MEPVSPVIVGLEPYEVAIGCKSHSEDVLPLKVLRSPEGRMLTRWTLTDEERKSVMDGADIFLTLWTFNEGFNPVALQVMRADIDSQIIIEGMDLEDDLRLRMLREEAQVAHIAFAERVQVLNAAQTAIVQKLSNKGKKPEGVLADAGDKGNNDQGATS